MCLHMCGKFSASEHGLENEIKEQTFSSHLEMVTPAQNTRIKENI